MTALCPCCGYNLRQDAVVERDGWRIDPIGVVEYRGERLRVRSQWAAILHCLAASDRAVKVDALLNRVSYSERPNAIASTISQLRKWLGAQGLPMPISSMRRLGGGYVWAG